MTGYINLYIISSLKQSFPFWGMAEFLTECLSGCENKQKQIYDWYWKCCGLNSKTALYSKFPPLP